MTGSGNWLWGAQPSNRKERIIIPICVQGIKAF